MLALSPLADPSALPTFAQAAATCVSSAGSGWDGAVLFELTTAPAEEIRHVHRLVCVQRWLTPARERTGHGSGDWGARPPGLALFLPGDTQEVQWRGSVRCQLLFVTPARVEAVLGASWERSGLGRWRGPRFDVPFVAHVLSAMLRDCEAGFPAGPRTGDALVAALLAVLDRRRVAPAPARSGALGPRLHHVVEHVEANLARPLRLAELAGLAGVGVRRFSTLFAEETGWPPHQYVIRRRIERAKVLMLDTRLTLAEIGAAVGFSDPAQFSRAFRKHTGEPPLAYRRR